MSLPADESEQLRKRVATWRRAGPALEEIRRRELEAEDTRKAVSQIFGSTWPSWQENSPTSGLVEQQAWFRRLREKASK